MYAVNITKTTLVLNLKKSDSKIYALTDIFEGKRKQNCKLINIKCVHETL